MISAAARGNPLNISLHFKDLLPPILKDLQSPLAAPNLCKLFVNLREVVFAKYQLCLGDLIANVTLR